MIKIPVLKIHDNADGWTDRQTGWHRQIDGIDEAHNGFSRAPK